MSERPRVLLVDDNDAILDRATHILSESCVIVGAVKNGAAALEAVGALQPDVVVLDVSMPQISGIEVAKRLRAMSSSAAVVFLTVHHDEDFIQAAERVGAMSYVLKPKLVTDLLVAVMAAHAGRPDVSETR